MTKIAPRSHAGIRRRQSIWGETDTGRLVIKVVIFEFPTHHLLSLVYLFILLHTLLGSDTTHPIYFVFKFVSQNKWFWGGKLMALMVEVSVPVCVIPFVLKPDQDPRYESLEEFP